MWRTKDGREIPIIAMTDSHLLNTIHMIRRRFVLMRAEGIRIYLADNGMWIALNRERRRRGLCGIHTGDCIWAKSETGDHSCMSRACYAKQREEHARARAVQEDVSGRWG